MSFHPQQARPALPPVPPQLKHHPSTGHQHHARPPLPPLPSSSYRAQAAAEQQRQRPPPIVAPHALTADNLRQVDYFSTAGPPHPPRAQSSAAYTQSLPPSTAPLSPAHSHQNFPHPSSLFLQPSPRIAQSTYAIPLALSDRGSQPPSPGALRSSKPISLPLIDLDMLTALYELHFRKQPDSAGQVHWASKVFKFIERSQGLETCSRPASPFQPDAKLPQTSKISDPLLVKYTDIALKTVLKYAEGSNPHLNNGGAEALYLRGDLYSTGAFPSYRAKDPRLAFRDFESAAHLGYYLAWFRIGREYENCEDWDRAIGAYEHGLAFEECACVYRLGMSYLLGQMNLPVDMAQAVVFLKKAAQLANEETPQPAYIYGMILAGEFESLPQIPQEILPSNLSESKYMLEKAAYLGFAAAQYKIGWCYEYSQITCPFDPLLSVEYYSLASQQGESEADMALSKWFLCGSEGYFAANEPLAVTFAEKAARKGLGSAMFALGYYLEVGIAGRQDEKAAVEWYSRAWHDGGNEDARERLESLGEGGHVVSRQQYEQQLDQKLVRKHTLAASRSPTVGEASIGVRRRETMRRVEEARRVAERGPMHTRQNSFGDSSPSPPFSVPPTPGSPSRSHKGHTFNGRNEHPSSHDSSTHPPQHLHTRPLLAHKTSTGNMINRLHSFQLSDDGPAVDAAPTKAQQKIEHLSPARHAPKTQFNSFADMGIQTAKAKKTEECIIV